MNKKSIVVTSVATITAVAFATLGLTAAQSLSSVSDYDTTFAENLGVDISAYCEAKKSTQTTMLEARATENDRSNSAFVTEMIATIQESECGIEPREGKHYRKGRNPELVAEFFGTTVEELRDARENGATLEDLLSTYGKTHEEFKLFIEENKPSRLERRQERLNNEINVETSETAFI